MTAKVDNTAINPVLELLRTRPSSVRSVAVAPGRPAGGAARVAEAARRAGIPVRVADRRELLAAADGGVHRAASRWTNFPLRGPRRPDPGAGRRRARGPHRRGRRHRGPAQPRSTHTFLCRLGASGVVLRERRAAGARSRSSRSGTRHNVGFAAVERLAADGSARFSAGGADAETALIRLAGIAVVLLKPQTFMNRSGAAVAAWLDRLALPAAGLVVVHDDLDLPLGRLRIVAAAGAGGHRGVRSIQDTLGTAEFPRVRVGIGRPEAGQAAAQRVLADFTPEERPVAATAGGAVGRGGALPDPGRGGARHESIQCAPGTRLGFAGGDGTATGTDSNRPREVRSVRSYEVIFILDPALGDDGVEAAAVAAKAVLAKAGGEVTEVQKWGKKRLAYDIKKRREGHYVYFRAQAPGQGRGGTGAPPADCGAGAQVPHRAGADAAAQGGEGQRARSRRGGSSGGLTMASFNKVILMGNLTRDPELRYTPSGAPVCNFDLAMNRSYTTQGGEKRDEVCYMTVVVWGKQAENCAEYLAKGRAALVEGHLQQRSWETPEGQKRSKHEVVAERVQFLGPRKGAAGAAGGEDESEPPRGPEQDEVPF